jgi:hypothetical protein
MYAFFSSLRFTEGTVYVHTIPRGLYFEIPLAIFQSNLRGNFEELGIRDLVL